MLELRFCFAADEFRVWLQVLGGRVLKGIDDVEECAVGGNIGHGVCIVNETHRAGLVDQHHCRHAAQPEQADLLPISFQHVQIRIRQPDEGQRFFFPISFECLGVLRPDGNDFGIPVNKLLIVIAQLREVRPAKRSHEPAIEYQEDVFAALEVG